MLETLNNKYPINNDLKVNLQSFVGVSLGIFLFLLFFQPFQIRNPDFDNQLLIIAGFGVITLLLLCILRILLPSVFPKYFTGENWTYTKELLLNVSFWVLNSVAFSFFARYVGGIEITFQDRKSVV